MSDRGKSAGSPSIIGRTWNLLTPRDRRGAVVVLALMLVGMILETLGVGLIVPALSLLTRSDVGQSLPVEVMEALGHPNHRQLVVYAMFALAAVFLIKGAFLAFLAWRQTRFAFDVQAGLSLRLFRLYMDQPYAFHLRRNSAELVRNVISEINILTFHGILPAMLIATEGLIAVGLVGLLVAIEPIGALASVTVLGLAALAFHRAVMGRTNRWGQARQEHEGRRLQHLQEGLGGAKDIKLLGREGEFIERYRLHNLLAAHAVGFQTTLQQLPRLWVEVLAVAGLAIVVGTMVWGGRSLEALLPTLGLFGAVVFRLMPSANRIIASAQTMRYALPVVHVLDRELRLPTPDTLVDQPMDSPRRLELKDVAFTYDGSDAPVLRGVTLSVRHGETVGFIGSSGAGKSTLVDVLLGLLSSSSGSIEVDGKDIRWNVRGWQRHIGYVPQSIYLTDDTLRRNIAFGIPDADIDDAAVRKAVHAAQLDEFVATLPAGLNAVIGERGSRISGGQRQRIGIARALYRDPAVLVLDEATSSLDTATERQVMDAVDALHGAKMIFIVAHRLTTLRRCDRVYHVRGGRILEVIADMSSLDTISHLEPGAA